METLSEYLYNIQLYALINKKCFMLTFMHYLKGSQNKKYSSHRQVWQPNIKNVNLAQFHNSALIMHVAVTEFMFYIATSKGFSIQMKK